MSTFFKKKSKPIIQQAPEKPDEAINELSKKIKERRYFPEDSEEGKKFISRRESTRGNNPDMDKSPWLQEERYKKLKEIDNEEMLQIKEKMRDSDKFYYDLINALPYVQGNIKMLQEKIKDVDKQCVGMKIGKQMECEKALRKNEKERKLYDLKYMERDINNLSTIYKPLEGGRRKSRKHRKTKHKKIKVRRTRQRRTKTKSRQRKKKHRKTSKRH